MPLGQSSEVLSNSCGMELKPSATMATSGMEVAGAWSNTDTGCTAEGRF